jgi:hypothetical protein
MSYEVNIRISPSDGVTVSRSGEPTERVTVDLGTAGPSPRPLAELPVGPRGAPSGARPRPERLEGLGAGEGVAALGPVPSRLADLPEP